MPVEFKQPSMSQCPFIRPPLRLLELSLETCLYSDQYVTSTHVLFKQKKLCVCVCVYVGEKGKLKYPQTEFILLLVSISATVPL